MRDEAEICEFGVKRTSIEEEEAEEREEEKGESEELVADDLFGEVGEGRHVPISVILFRISIPVFILFLIHFKLLIIYIFILNVFGILICTPSTLKYEVHTLAIAIFPLLCNILC